MKIKFYKIADVIDKLTRIDDRWRTDSDLGAQIEAFEKVVNFSITDNVSFQHGVAHVGVDYRLGNEPTFGRSMVDAWSAFEHVLMHLGDKKVRWLRDIVDEDILENCVSFGSPHSNFVARLSLGYSLNSGSMQLIPEADDLPFMPKIRYGDGGYGHEVDRAGYSEGQWDLSCSDGGDIVRLIPPLGKTGQLTKDYLVLSCVPNMGSSVTREHFRAKRDLAQLARADLAERDTPEYRKKRDALIRMRDRKAPLRTLIVGGLHGPGTAAAKHIFTSPERLKRLSDALRDHDVAGRPWQALYEVGNVERRTVDGVLRDVPVPESIKLAKVCVLDER